MYDLQIQLKQEQQKLEDMRQARGYWQNKFESLLKKFKNIRICKHYFDIIHVTDSSIKTEIYTNGNDQRCFEISLTDKKTWCEHIKNHGVNKYLFASDAILLNSAVITYEANCEACKKSLNV